MHTRQLQQVAQSCPAIAMCGDVIAQQSPWATIACLGPALSALDDVSETEIHGKNQPVLVHNTYKVT